jgi:beta-mannosidase
VDVHFLTWKDACQNRLRHYFGKEFDFDPWQDFALGVNIICGDMFKFTIEYSRALKWKKTGVLWWSLLDMWPMMFNYSVVDYNFKKKMPYYWIRQSQQPFCLMVVEREEIGNPELFAANDTLKEWKGSYAIYRVGKQDERVEIASGSFVVAPNCNMKLQTLVHDDMQSLWMIEWVINDGKYYNHFVSGKPPFEFDQWKKWNTKLLKLYSSTEK